MSIYINGKSELQLQIDSIETNQKKTNLKNLSSLISNNFGTSPNKAICYCGSGRVVVGSGTGKISVSTDYGRNWSSLKTSNTTNQINSIARSSVTGTLLAVTDGGEVVRSTDGGDTWSSPIANAFGGSDINMVRADSSGVFHLVGDGGKYTRSTDDGATIPALITVNTGAVILDNIYCGPGFVMISAHSNKLVRSTDGGVTWSATIATPFVAGDAIWIIEGDGGSKVLIGVYETDRGKFALSVDGGLTFGAIQSVEPFVTLNERMIYCRYIDGVWVIVGDGGVICYSFDLVTWERIKDNPFVGGIVYKTEWLDSSFLFVGATGRISKTLINYEEV